MWRCQGALQGIIKGQEAWWLTPVQAALRPFDRLRTGFDMRLRRYAATPLRRSHGSGDIIISPVRTE